MKAKKLLILSVLTLGSTSPLHAETLSFSDVWRKISANSPAQEGAQLKAEAFEEGLSRAKKHWLPKVYFDARTYQTNDPGSAFFGLLEQRKVENADFSPDSLNHPDTQTFTRGAVGLDLPLYEGGMKSAQSAMYKNLAKAEKLNAAQTQVEQYAHSGFAYGAIVSIDKNKSKLKEVNDEIAKLMKGYQLGQKSNPVGYSGLLGMKSLANRVSGLIEHLDAQEKASYSALREMGVTDSNWSPQNIELTRFVDDYFKIQPADQTLPSYKAQAFTEAAGASEKMSQMEKARHLPRVGAFAETFMFKGDRDTADGYTAGLYLQWSLFDPADFGKYKEAKLNSQAAEKFSRAALQQENAERDGLAEAGKALRANLSRLDESDKLLAEQSKVSSTLFKNGSINALQFVEILNRRVDLILQQSETELHLLKNTSERAQKSKFEVPNVAIGGGQK